MVTAAQLRKLALSFPETEEKSHFEQPDFRVRNKIFAGLSRDGSRGTLKLSPEVQAAALQTHPGAFAPAEGAWGRSGWTYVRLGDVDAATLRELVGEAWRLTAPKRLAAKHPSGAATGAKDALRSKPSKAALRRKAPR
jgi:hypothetical protein